MYLEELNLKGIVDGAGEVIGGVFDNHNEQKWSAPECGKRPLFIGRRRNEWEQCRAQAQTLPTSPGAPETRQKNFFQQNKTPLLIGGGILAGVLIFRALNKK